MPIVKPIPRRRCINYKKRVAPVITRMEEKLCDEMGLTISELHVEGIRRMWNTRQTFEQLQLEMI